MRPKYSRTRPIAEARMGRLATLLERFGFIHEREGFANYVMGWSRVYNLSRAEGGKSFKRGATGVQCDWRINAAGECTGTLTTWRN